MEDYILLGVVTGLLFTLYFGPIISYGCFIILRRLNQYLLSYRRQNLSSTMMSPPLSHGGSAVCLVSSFKFMKGEEGDKTQLDSDTECSICLSDFEDGEEVRKLPMCDHCFHAYCIDRWLFSHFDCPLCRAPVVEPPPPSG